MLLAFKLPDDLHTIEAYFLPASVPLDESNFNLDLNGDGDKTDVGVQTNVFLIRKNPAGLDLEIKHQLNP